MIMEKETCLRCVRMVLITLAILGLVFAAAGSMQLSYAQTSVFAASESMDDEQYYYDLMFAFDKVYYGDTEVWFSTPFDGVTAEAEINGTTYTGTYYGYTYNARYGEYKHEYVIKGIPFMEVGTKINYTLRKGEAVYSDTVTVQRAQLDVWCYLEFSSDRLAYNGKPQTPSIDVVFYNIESRRVLKEGTDYTVSWSNNKNIGVATVKITGINNYTGSRTGTFKIVPKGTSISKVKAAKKGFTVKWKKQAVQTTGYQIQYSLKSKFKGAQTVTIGKTKTVSKKIKKLKAKKTYYVRIRTYKKVGGKTYYSDWSTVKKVKTK